MVNNTMTTTVPHDVPSSTHGSAMPPTQANTSSYTDVVEEGTGKATSGPPPLSAFA